MFAISTLYGVGQFVRRITATPKAQWVMRVTTAGTSAATEPTWPTANNGTVTSGGAVFTNVTAQSAYGWSAAAGDLPTLLGAVGPNRFAAGDRIFVSSDHAETQTTATTYGSGNGTAGYAVGQVLSVDRAGSVPPVSADLTAGASVTVSGATILTFDATFPVYHYGLSYVYTGTSNNAISFGTAGNKTNQFDTCQLYLNTATAAIQFTAANQSTWLLYNSTLRFGNVAQNITGARLSQNTLEIIWLNTPSAIAGATIPTALFFSGNAQLLVTARGVDLSAITGALVREASGGITAGGKFLFDSCRIASGVTRMDATTGPVTNTRALVELVNCFDGTNIINERYVPAGTVTTERTITLAGGATDDLGLFSHKLVSGTNIDKFVNTLDGFSMDTEYQTTGSSKTATVEIISSASLNNDEISLWLQYQGTAGSPVASVASTGPGSVLGTPSALPTSTATWNSSPSTPVKQQLSVTFTPQTAGRVRGQVRLGKSSTTVYINPVITIT